MTLSDRVGTVRTAIAVMLLSSPLALITFLVIPPLLILTNLIREGMRSSFRAVRIRLARVNATIAENISGIHVIQLFNRERTAAEHFDAINRDLLRAHLRGVLFFAIFWPLVGVAAAVTTGAIVWYGGSPGPPGVFAAGGGVELIHYFHRVF